MMRAKDNNRLQTESTCFDTVGVAGSTPVEPTILGGVSRVSLAPPILFDQLQLAKFNRSPVQKCGKGVKAPRVLYPTGTCFEDVTQEFVRMIAENRSRFKDPALVMVHGICRMPDGRLYSHAWIERDGEAHFSGIIDGLKSFARAPVGEFDAVYEVQERTRYTADEAMHEALKHDDMPPPWDPRYRALCKDSPLKPVRSEPGRGQ